MQNHSTVLPTPTRRSKFDASGNAVLCMGQLNLSARAYHHVLKLARTIADLTRSKEIQSPHLAEVCTLRSRPKLMMG